MLATLIVLGCLFAVALAAYAVNKTTQFGTERQMTIDPDSPMKYVHGLGVVADSTYITATEYGDGVVHKTVLTCAALPLAMTDEAGQGQYGGAKLYRKLLPGFLGLVLAEFSAAGLWVAIDAICGVRGHQIFSF